MPIFNVAKNPVAKDDVKKVMELPTSGGVERSPGPVTFEQESMEKSECP